jgi:hypothetical protein
MPSAAGRAPAATSAPATVALAVTDLAPVAAADSYAAGGALAASAAGGVLSNDSDPDGDALRAVLVSGPSHGTLALNADGSFAYTPAAGFSGADGFTYLASDGVLGSAAAVAIAVAPLPPQVSSVAVNDGSSQRSMVTSLTVTFSGVVLLPADPAAAFQLAGPGGAVALSASAGLDPTGAKTQVVLTFSGAGVVAGSLADGRYTLTVLGGAITDSSGQQLDGDGDGAAGGNDLAQFFRLFGDANGDGTVSRPEQNQFRKASGTSPGQRGYVWYFDYDGLNGINSYDQSQFNLRLGSRI